MIFLELLSMQHVPWVERYLLGISNWAFLVLLSNQDSYENILWMKNHGHCHGLNVCVPLKFQC